VLAGGCGPDVGRLEIEQHADELATVIGRPIDRSSPSGRVARLLRDPSVCRR